MLEPATVKVEPKHLGEMDCFASLAMTAKILTPLFLLVALAFTMRPAWARG
jgi:hypothetical protein